MHQGVAVNTYLEAAKIIVEGKREVCCFALEQVGHVDFKTFAKIYKPTKNERAKYECYPLQGWFGTNRLVENQVARSLALLFMHELTKAK